MKKILPAITAVLLLGTSSMQANNNTYVYSNVEYCQLVKSEGVRDNLTKQYKSKLVKSWKKEHGVDLDRKHISRSTCKSLISKYGSAAKILS